METGEHNPKLPQKQNTLKPPLAIKSQPEKAMMAITQLTEEYEEADKKKTKGWSQEARQYLNIIFQKVTSKEMENEEIQSLKTFIKEKEDTINRIQRILEEEKQKKEDMMEVLDEKNGQIKNLEKMYTELKQGYENEKEDGKDVKKWKQEIKELEKNWEILKKREKKRMNG